MNMLFPKQQCIALRKPLLLQQNNTKISTIGSSVIVPITEQTIGALCAFADQWGAVDTQSMGHRIHNTH